MPIQLRIMTLRPAVTLLLPPRTGDCVVNHSADRAKRGQSVKVKNDTLTRIKPGIGVTDPVISLDKCVVT